MSDEKRDTRRVEAAFRVRYRTLDELVVAYTQDLSRGGTFLRSQRFLPINAVIRLHIELPEGGGEIAAIARVAFVRGNDEALATGKPPGMGIQFLDLAGAGTERIERFIAERTAVEVEKSGPLPIARRRKVLVVDDDDAYRELAVGAMRDRGHVVRAAVDGLEALGMCLKEAPELIISDVQMPRMDGWQFLRVIRARPSLAAIPVIFVTTLSGEEERLRGYQLGVDDYIPKPYSADELGARVERVIARELGHDKKSLRGELDQVGLASVLTFLELERKTGVLLVVSTSSAARLYLRDGRLLRVERDAGGPPARSRDLFRECMEWSAGQFEFAACEVATSDELGSSITALLLEYARVKDEAAR